jgi:formylglycine-generating enzyme required for sulfatase activity
MKGDPAMKLIPKIRKTCFLTFRRLMLGIVLLLSPALVAAAKPSITVDKVEQRWPWNNKVDITYSIAGDDIDQRVARVVLRAIVDGARYVVYNGAVNVNASAGTHTVTWADPPAGVNCRDCRIVAEYYSELVPAGNDYMIVDLANGAVTYEGLFSASESLGISSGQEISNIRYNQPKYKSTHLVLRKIPKGTYQTGDSASYGTGAHLNNTKTWTTDRDFYISLFQWTNFQYWYVFNLGVDRPESQVNLKARALGFVCDIRGSADVTKPPEGHQTPNRWQILSWLNGKTGLSFDLPTEVMHEIASRAGTTTKYIWGNNVNDAPNYAVYGRTGSRPGDGWSLVGTKRPNAWGLYDMVGNDWQWCLDAYVAEQDPAQNVDAFTPFTSAATVQSVRVRAGDAALRSAADLNPARRSAANAGTLTASPALYSVRVAYIVPKTGD